MIAALMPTYNRADLAFERGEGAWLWTADGRRFLDFGAGIATSSLGHNHPHLVAAIAEQAARVMHVSNLYRVPQAERLAARLVEATFADSVFFCNSGAEANEGMVKMIRKAQAETGHPERFRVICFDGAFHGRTLAMLAATGNAKYLKGFGPPVEGFDHVPFNNMNAVRNAIGPADRRHHRRADAGRGRHPARVTAIPARPARRLRRVRHLARPRRGAERHGPHRQAVRLSNGRASSRT